MNEHIVEFVRLGYHQAEAFDFLIDVRGDWATFHACLNVIADAYGDLFRREVRDELRSLFGEFSAVEVGRNGSPLIRMTLPLWRHQKIGTDPDGANRPLADSELRSSAQQVVDAGRRLGADEIYVQQFDRATGEAGDVEAETGAHPYAIRLWWD